MKPFAPILWFALAVAGLHAAESAVAVQAPRAIAPTPGWSYAEQRRFPAPEAGQGVAADRDFVYAIDNHTIAKYRKTGGGSVALWEGGKDGPIVHLNAGVVREGRLYCAHSNYPAVPMLSSVEIFDTATLKHLGTQSFGRTDGSLTWIDRRNGKWIACFVHYGKKGGEPGRGPEWTQIVEFDDQWRRTGGWGLPAALVAHLGTRGYSVSGGAIGPGGHLYATGHDEPKLYVLDFPTAGSALTWTATIPITAEGQAFGWDPQSADVLYTIGRRTREVIVGRVKVP